MFRVLSVCMKKSWVLSTESSLGTYSKTCVKWPIFAKCRSKVLQNAPREYSAILWTCIKLSPVSLPCGP